MKIITESIRLLEEDDRKIIRMKKTQLNPWKKKIKAKVVAQYHLKGNPHATIQEIIECPLMRIHVIDVRHDKNQQKQLRNDIASITGKGVSGRPSNCMDDNPRKRKTTSKIIPEVLEKSGDIFYCDFDLLETLINTVVKINTDESVLRMDLGSFEKQIKIDPILKKYLTHVPNVIGEFVEDKIKEFCSVSHGSFLTEMILRDIPKQWTVQLNGNLESKKAP